MFYLHDISQHVDRPSNQYENKVNHGLLAERRLVMHKCTKVFLKDFHEPIVYNMKIETDGVKESRVNIWIMFCFFLPDSLLVLAFSVKHVYC